ncbi:MAG: hypothetical protein FJY80_03755 [Candidatus Aminicenantes bacterium]|nr:hypothetical protein [Candidatus Aminicenantes bacterium]
MKFVVDVMLGKLAKWLRILGFDAAFSPRAEDDDLLALARREGRTLLTRDRALLGRARGVASLLIESETWEDQVRQVIARYGLREAVRPHSRCLECNAALAPLPKEDAAPLVPAFVLETSASFARCPSCGRVYWPGTHFEAMRAKMDLLLGAPSFPPSD